MRSIFSSACILLIALTFNACKGGKKDEGGSTKDTTATVTTNTSESTGASSPLEGTWVVKLEDNQAGGDQVGTTYEFKGNKLTTGKDGVNMSGTTEVTDNTFSMLMEGAKEKIIYNYHMEGDTLVVKMADGPQEFKLVKN